MYAVERMQIKWFIGEEHINFKICILNYKSLINKSIDIWIIFICLCSFILISRKLWDRMYLWEVRYWKCKL